MEKGERNNLVPFLVGGVLLGGISVVALHHERLEVAAKHALSPFDIRSAAAQTPTVKKDATSVASSNSSAAALYRRTLLASQKVSVAAHVTAVQSNELERIEFDLIEGSGGRYRMTFQSPRAIAGRVLVCDGKAMFQYEPSRNLVLSRPTIPSPHPLTPATMDAIWEERDGSLVKTIRDGSAKVAGRPVIILTAQENDTDTTLRERRFIDKATGRSLRWERFDSQGKLLRRVEFTNVTFSPKITAETFVADFPKTARVLAARSPRTSPEALAHQFNLPETAHGLRVRSAIPASSSSKDRSVVHESSGDHHLLYSDGARSVSVFISALPSSEAVADQLTPGRGWTTVDGEPLPLLVHTDMSADRAAVAWLRSGHRYVAVAHMPLPTLLPIVRALRADR